MNAGKSSQLDMVSNHCTIFEGLFTSSDPFTDLGTLMDKRGMQPNLPHQSARKKDQRCRLSMLRESLDASRLLGCVHAECQRKRWC